MCFIRVWEIFTQMKNWKFDFKWNSLILSCNAFLYMKPFHIWLYHFNKLSYFLPQWNISWQMQDWNLRGERIFRRKLCWLFPLKIIITKCYNIIYNSSSFLSDLLNNDFRLGNIFNEEKCPDSLWLRQRLTVNVNKILVKEASFKERVTKRGKILVKVKKSQSSAGRLWESYGWTVEDVWEYLKNVMCWSKEEVLEEFNSLRMWGCWRL